MWSKSGQSASGYQDVSTESPEISEQMERLKDADFVRELQKRLGADSTAAANDDKEPDVRNIFRPTDENSPR